jgi:FixJ family two-component response regulator
MLEPKGSEKLSSATEISIIDDDASVRTAVSRLIRSLGYTANAFPSAEAFLNSPQINTTSCLIADVQMPRMSGLELQELLSGRGRQLPIIFITAFPEDGIRARALYAGAIGFLAKPIDGTALVEQIQTALGKSADAVRTPEYPPDHK